MNLKGSLEGGTMRDWERSREGWGRLLLLGELLLEGG
jgi:hypothetical protein